MVSPFRVPKYPESRRRDVRLSFLTLLTIVLILVGSLLFRYYGTFWAFIPGVIAYVVLIAYYFYTKPSKTPQ